jgi:beta-glucosidase
MSQPTHTTDHDGAGAGGTDYAALVASLDLDTKVTLLTGASAFSLAPEPSIGLAEVRMSDGPTGVRGLGYAEARPVTLFPNATLLASAWSEDTAYEVGALLAEEAMAQEIHVVLGPTINLHRSPLGGRLFEAYSEDPLLSGRLAAAYVRGLQDSGVGACVKHLIANESETVRSAVNSVVDEATLREVYLLAFELAVDEADPWSLMAAYNLVNGVPATEQDHVINDIVKGEWGYRGVVVSDWLATRTAAPAANGGLDLVMPGPFGPWGAGLVKAVQDGEVAESVIDDHVGRVLRLADRVGALGEPREWPRGLPEPDSRQRKEQMTRLAAEGMTVVQNHDAALPLRREETVALVGRHAIDTICMGGGSAQVPAPHQVSVAEGLTALLGERVTVQDGVEVRRRPVADPAFVTDPVTGEPGIHAWLYAADGSLVDERHEDAGATVVALEHHFRDKVTRVVLHARAHHRGPMHVGVIGSGDWALEVGSHAVPFRLRSSGASVAEEMIAPPAESTLLDVHGPTLITATVETQHPLGTTHAELADGHDSAVFSASSMATLGLIAHAPPRPSQDVIADAAAAAARADVAVVVVGLTEEEETEAADKTTLRLAGAQDAMVSAVAAAARRTVVVVNAATPVLMPWLGDVDAVLWAGLPGQEGGHAVAAALLGDIEPAGRLVTTFPADDGAAPAWSVTPVDGDVVYGEGPFLGYRGHHAGRAPAPAFWFGHGLGYSEWEYSDATVAGDGDAPVVSVTVTNVGARDSREIVQVYLVPDVADQPVRLVGWEAVHVAPGESAAVTIETERRMWRRWNAAEERWDPLPGGQLLLARGLGDVRASLTPDPS